jgi:hypothetical protein
MKPCAITREHRIVMSHNTHDYVGECSFEPCPHTSISIYKSHHKYKHYNNKLVHDSCYTAMHKKHVAEKNKLRQQQLEEKSHQMQDITPIIEVPPPPPSAAFMPAIVITQQQQPICPFYHPPNNISPNISFDPITREQQRLLIVLHSFNKHDTYYLFTQDYLHCLAKKQYHAKIKQICLAIDELYDRMMNNIESHMKNYVIDVQSNLILQANFQYKSREQTLKNGAKKILYQGNYPNEESSHAMELKAFKELIELLRQKRTIKYY